MTDTGANVSAKGWALDRHIPVALIFALILQTATLGYYMGQMSARLTEVESKLVRKEDEGGRITALETQMKIIAETLRRIEQKLDNR